jgi:hypothetical protein
MLEFTRFLPEQNLPAPLKLRKNDDNEVVIGGGPAGSTVASFLKRH